MRNEKDILKRNNKKNIRKLPLLHEILTNSFEGYYFNIQTHIQIMNIQKKTINLAKKMKAIL